MALARPCQLSVIPHTVRDDCPLLNSTRLQRRKAIDVIVAGSTAASAFGTLVLAANAGAQLYDRIAVVFKGKSDQNSCTLTYETESDDGYYMGYAYEATTTGSNCDTTALEKTMKNAVYSCADKLHNAGAVRGCCQFTHGGTWTRHLRLSADPAKYPATGITC